MEDKDYIIITENGKPLTFNDGQTVVYGSYEEAKDDLHKTDLCVIPLEDYNEIVNKHSQKR
jgi:hypothetical protein